MRTRTVGALCAFALAGAALLLNGRPASAHIPPCDFITGGGFIIRDSGANGNFGVGGGCKHGSPTWGHLEYHDHGTGLNVHWLTITAYLFVEGDLPPDPPEQPTGMRRICGTARTNQFDEVDFLVQVKDVGEPGTEDEFVLRLSQGGFIVYTTEHDSDRTLGGPGPGGGNIQLHRGNESNSGDFGGSCPALDAVEP